MMCLSLDSRCSGAARLRRALAAGLVCLVSLPPVAAAVGREPAAPPELARAQGEIVERSNTFRRSNGLAPLAPNAALGAAAAEFAGFMARTGRYSHEADGREPAERAEAQGYAWCLVAENIAYMSSSVGIDPAELPERFVQGWIDSPGHRRNLLAPAATEIGVAIAGSARGDRYYAVQMFGRPAALRMHFELANRSDQPVSYELGDKRYSLAPGATRRHEQCTVATLRVALPGRPEPIQLQPAAGASYRIEPSGRGLRLAGG